MYIIIFQWIWCFGGWRFQFSVWWIVDSMNGADAVPCVQCSSHILGPFSILKNSFVASLRSSVQTVFSIVKYKWNTREIHNFSSITATCDTIIQKWEQQKKTKTTQKDIKLSEIATEEINRNQPSSNWCWFFFSFFTYFGFYAYCYCRSFILIWSDQPSARLDVQFGRTILSLRLKMLKNHILLISIELLSYNQMLKSSTH